MNHDIYEINLGSAVAQTIFGILRLLLLIFLIYFFTVEYSASLHQIDIAKRVEDARAANEVFGRLPPLFVGIVVAVREPLIIRYLIAPMAAFLCVMFAGAFFLKDVYNHRNLGDALHYILSSMFTIATPKLIVDKGAPKLRKNETNLIHTFGGPGTVLIEPGSAGIFRTLRSQSGCKISGKYFLGPFETIGHTVDLDEQQEDLDKPIPCMTRDGIQLNLCDVHFRYRILFRRENGKPVVRTEDNPYPFDQEAYMRMIPNLSVGQNGPDTWATAVNRVVTGVITDYIAEHTLDNLTAPRVHNVRPRLEIPQEVFNQARRPLERLGAELLWIDVGHFEIIDERVDEQRTSLWAADWIGDAAAIRAFGEARRQAYQELGRAEAQAEMIISISEALAGANLGNEPTENIRRLFLARTAQILDALADNTRKTGNGHE